DAFRVVQFTPPGSGCSVSFGTGVTDAGPGPARPLELGVSDIDAAREELEAHGVEHVEIFHASPWSRVPGPDPERQSYRTYGAFTDPDGNEWVLQEVTTRLPGRIDPGQPTFSSEGDLAAALRRADAPFRRRRAPRAPPPGRRPPLPPGPRPPPPQPGKGADAELGEHLRQVPFDGARAD